MRPLGFGATDVGRVRSSNEDRFFASDELGLYLVCDGMGGHAAGEVAAQIATDTVVKAMKKGLADSQATRGGPPSPSELQDVLRHAIHRASLAVYAEATANPEHAGMGCTITALQFLAGKAIMAHVGDTRLYLLRDGAAELLSADHTFAADMVRRGELTPTAARDHQYANALTRCVGSQDAVQVDSLVLDVGPDDRFLVCSDGFSGYVESLSELASALAGDDPAAIPAELIQLANDRGGKDNITAIAVVMEASDDEMEQLLAINRECRRDLEALRGLELFASISFADSLRVLNYSEAHRAAAGEQVVGQEGPHDRLALVLAGKFELRNDDDSSSVPMSVGDYIGDTAMLVSPRQAFTLRAIDDGRILFLTGDRLRELSRRRPWLGVKMMTSIAAKLSKELATAGERLRETVDHSRPPGGGLWGRLVALVRGR